MIKRWLTILLSLVLCCGIFISCQTNKVFYSESDMISFCEGVWKVEDDSEVYYIIKDNNVQRYYGYEIEDAFIKLENDQSIDLEKISFEEFCNDYFVFKPFALGIEYDFKEGKVISSSGKELFNILEDGSIKYVDEVLQKISSSPEYFKDLIKNEFDSEIQTLIFDRKYPELPSAREVQYNKFNYLTKNFLITGTAELDDYYNWGYDGLEAMYFCIRVRPIGGSYSDEWYIYADRQKFDDLYQSILSSSKSVSLVCQMWFYETGSNNMATLVDYKK